MSKECKCQNCEYWLERVNFEKGFCGALNIESSRFGQWKHFKRKERTIGQIIDELKQILNGNAEDFRPTCTLFGVPSVPYSVYALLKNGGKIIYIPPELVDKLEDYVKERNNE